VPMVARSTEQDRVEALQHALYRAAKADPGRQFHALYDKVDRRDVLERASELVGRNRGAPGIDRLTIQQVERYGVDRLLDQLAAALKDGGNRPLPAEILEQPRGGWG
jgi:RNA-directed DNA polymerase